MYKVKRNSKIKKRKDAETLNAFRNRIIEVKENPSLGQVDVLKVVHSTYSLMRISLSDAATLEESNKIVETFIDNFLESMQAHISLLQQRTKASRTKQLNT